MNHEEVECVGLEAGFAWGSAIDNSCPVGFRYIIIDEFEEDEEFLQRAKEFLGAWSFAGVVNGWLNDD